VNSPHAVFPQAVLDSFERNPDTPAFEHGSRVVSRGQALELIARFASGLRAAGLGRGDGVAIATGVTPEGFAVQTAAHVLGCRVVGVRPGLTPSQLAYIVGSGVDAVLADELTESPELLAAAAAVPGGAVKVLRVGPELLGENVKPVAEAHSDDLAVVTFTSGSTGSPKGVAYSYRAMSEHWTWQPARWSDHTATMAEGYSRFLLFGTLTSAVIQEHLGLCLLSGGTAVIPPGLPVFPQMVEELRLTASLLTPPRLHHVLDVLREQSVDISSWQSIMVGGSPLAPHRLAEAHERIGGAVRQAYGQTETGVLTWLSIDDVAQWPETLASVGRAGGDVEIEVRDDAGRPVPAGGIGEIWARTPYQFSGYWRDEKQTAETLRDGWVSTLDLGRLDERGFLYLTGRAREVVIVNAIIHYVGPIEQVLASHGDVDQAYVVGAPDEQTGEAAHAFVVPAAGRAPDAEALRALVAAELGQAAVPSTFTVVASVPLGASGKPDKRALLG
jgi:fatty-acyl-CoA synthase